MVTLISRQAGTHRCTVSPSGNLGENSDNNESGDQRSIPPQPLAASRVNRINNRARWGFSPSLDLDSVLVKFTAAVDLELWVKVLDRFASSAPRMSKLPGNAGVSLLGDKSLEFYRDPVSFYRQRVDKHRGRVFQGRLLNRPTVFICSAGGMRELLCGMSDRCVCVCACVLQVCRVGLVRVTLARIRRDSPSSLVSFCSEAKEQKVRLAPRGVNFRGTSHGRDSWWQRAVIEF